MSKKYWTSYVASCVPDWTPRNAVREFVQNMLDSKTESEYVLDSSYLEFTSVNTTLPPACLLTGESGKRSDPDAVGGKGEGFKLGCLILLRNGYKVEIRNGDKIWTPSFELHPDFDRECLVFTETNGNPTNKDLSFMVIGDCSDLLEDIRYDCLYLQEDIGTILEGSTGRVLKDIPNRLYVGGLHVCDIHSKYSYDFKPQYLPLNRDRKSVDTWDLTRNTTKLLEEVMPAKELAVLAKDHTLDSGGYYTRFKSDEVAEEFYQLAKEEYGNTFVAASTYYEADKLQERGFKNVKVVSNSNDLALIQQAPSYQEFLEELKNVVEPEDTRTPLEILREWWEDQSYDDFEKILTTFEERGIIWEDK